jgi:transcription antitermination factor NusA-like protein
LRGEKIDVIKWAPESAQFIMNALQPAKVLNVELFDDEGVALVTVPDYQLSLAIGREGQNVRLAARLTGWRLDITSEADAAEARERYLAERADRGGATLDGGAEETVAVAAEGEPATVPDIDEDLLRKLEEFKREMFEN